MEPGEKCRIGALLKYDRGWEDRTFHGAGDVGTVFSLCIIIRRYSEWDLTKAEYDEILPTAPDIAGI